MTIAAAPLDTQPDTGEGSPAEAYDQLVSDGLTIGDLTVRFAGSPAEIEAAQRLRYTVFYREMQAEPTAAMRAATRDFDRFDEIADHLLVIDRRRGNSAAAVVGTYRLVRQERAMAHGGFYTSEEYDIAPLVKTGESLLELGRSCVAAGYRTRPSMELLWRGIAAYVFHHEIGYMFGCGSLPGTDIDAHANTLAWLHANHLAPEAWRPVALAERMVAMDRLAPEQINPRRALADLPPLIKGYLRLGGVVGDGAVVDPQFNTTDVCVIVRTLTVTGKYIRHYARAAGERGA